jgi:hypothetical protein
MFVGNAGAYQREAPVDSLLAIHTNIRQGWEVLAGTNTLPFYELLQITV